MSDQPPVRDALATLEATPQVLRVLLAGLAAEVIEAPADEDWTLRDVVAHLVTTELPFAERFRRICEEDEPLLPDIDERDLLARDRQGKDGARPLAALLDDLAARRAEDVGMLRSLAPEAWTRAGRHALVGEVTLAELVCHKAYHDHLHIAQLARMLGGPFDAARGAMQAF
jgi:hypothetical protein